MKYLLLLLSFSLTACDSLTQEVSPDQLTDESSKLVVQCFLSPQDTLLRAKITRSRIVLSEELYGPDYGSNVSNATVTLSDGSRSIMLNYDSLTRNYRAEAQQLPIRAGQTYQLTVQTPAGERAESTCTIPAPVPIASIAFDSLTGAAADRILGPYFVQFRWKDPAGQPNYFQVFGEFRFVVNCPNCTKNPNYNKEEEYYNYLTISTSSLSTDRYLDGDSLLSPRAFLGPPRIPLPGLFDSTLGFYTIYTSASVTAHLLNAEKTYYDYQDAIERQNTASNNPFAEPVPIPSNIEGGLGCFAGYNRSTVTLKLK